LDWHTHLFSNYNDFPIIWFIMGAVQSSRAALLNFDQGFCIVKKGKDSITDLKSWKLE
jgi:hypothetical protein